MNTRKPTKKDFIVIVPYQWATPEWWAEAIRISKAATNPFQNSTQWFIQQTTRSKP